MIWMYRGVAVALLFFAMLFWAAAGAFAQQRKDTGQDTSVCTSVGFFGGILMAVLAVLLLCSPAAHAGETVRYHTLGNRVYGSDGSVTHQFGDRMYQRWPDGRQTVCHQLGSSTYCTSDR